MSLHSPDADTLMSTEIWIELAWPRNINLAVALPSPLPMWTFVAENVIVLAGTAFGLEIVLDFHSQEAVSLRVMHSKGM